MERNIYRSMPFFRLIGALLIAGTVAVSWLVPISPGNARSMAPLPQQQAQSLLDSLTPEERVGQLFLITFKGTDAGPETAIYDLITNHHIGGVVLLAANDNIVDLGGAPSEVPYQVLTLTRQLQQDDWNGSLQSLINPNTNQNYTPAFIPLLIGVSQEGDGYPYDQILRGMTLLPNAMAIGATWEPEQATQVGAITGKELSTLGINLLLGPSLDVLETPPPLEIASNLGTRSFGGDPYWVGEMGRAYIRGVHQGSTNKIAVVAKHFPGHGSSDRLPEEEVATVRKSLEQLVSFDLAPFFAVTGNTSDPVETADALLASHIRYQGLQGNIRATTRPVSFDPQAFGLLMNLPSLSAWRQNGGLMISDDLGSRAVRRFYDLTNQTFDARRVALNAFLAGNDLLYIADFSTPNDPDSNAAAIRTIEFFSQKYREDTAFAQRVDASVLRILTLKFRLYSEAVENTGTGQNTAFNLEKILATPDGLDTLGRSSQVTFGVAQQAATLISPSQAELEDTMPDPPDRSDRIVFITDVRMAQQCSLCLPYPQLDIKAMQDAVTRLYGSPSGGQILSYNLSSYSLDDLETMLDTPEMGQQLAEDLTHANWIVFGMLSARIDIPSFNTLSRFLSERPDLLQQKRLIVFAFTAPYYLDATNISKLSAYYSLYDKTPQFVDVAAYLLFRELRPHGASPVSVPAIGYDLNEALFPDSSQTILLELDIPPVEPPQTTLTPVPPPPSEFRIGDVIPLRTGVILDFNGHPVPDGTPVTFIFSLGGETNSTRQELTTIDGQAHTTYAVNNPGTLEIHVESENARSDTLKFNIPSPTGEITATPTPTPIPPTPTPLPPTPTSTPAPTPSVPVEEPPQPGFGDWLIAVLVSSALAWSCYRLAALMGQVRWGMRAGFLTFIGGLLAYSYLVMKLPGTEKLLSESISRSVFLSTVGGAALGLVTALAWRTLARTQSRVVQGITSQNKDNN